MEDQKYRLQDGSLYVDGRKVVLYQPPLQEGNKPTRGLLLARVISDLLADGRLVDETLFEHLGKDSSCWPKDWVELGRDIRVVYNHRLCDECSSYVIYYASIDLKGMVKMGDRTLFERVRIWNKSTHFMTGDLGFQHKVTKNTWYDTYAKGLHDALYSYEYIALLEKPQ